LEKPAIYTVKYHHQTLFFGVGGPADRGLCSTAQRSLSHELRTSSSSHEIACSRDGDGGDDKSNSYSGEGGDNDYGGGGGGGDSDGDGHKQQTTIN
jgi:hypothetical protein